MKRFFTLLSGLLLAAVIGLAQGKWEQSSVTPYGTGGINRSGERIDNSYSAGKFNSEVKSTSKNNPYVYFRKGQFSVPARTYQPGQTIPVNISLTVQRHSGKGTPKGSAGAVLVNGKAGQGTSVGSAVSVSGKDAAKSGSVTLTVPSHAAAGNNFSIVYSCFDIKVVYLYRWVEDKPAVREEPAVVANDRVPQVVDSVAAYEFEEDELYGEESDLDMEPDPDSLALAAALFGEETLTEEQPEEEKRVKAAPEKKDADILLSVFGLDLTQKDVIIYGIIAGLGLLVLILLLVILFRKNPEKKAAKEEAKKAAAEARAAARAEAAEKAAAAKAAAAEKAAAMKAEREAKLAEQKAAAAEKAAAAKAAHEAKAAELKKKQEAAKAEAAEKAPAAKRFCENCGAPLAPDAVFCENCGTKVS